MYTHIEKDRIIYLIKETILKRISSEEMNELLELIGKEGVDMMNEYYSDHVLVSKLHMADELLARKETVWVSISNIMELKNSKTSSRKKNKYFTAAAVTIPIFIIGFYFLNPLSQKDQIAESSDKIDSVITYSSKDVTLTLSSGKVICLDSLSDGKLHFEGSSLTKTDRHLQYQSTSDSAFIPTYNKIATLGGDYKVILPDGSLAWLNSHSSVKFTTSFTGNERMVEITGEVYFEIKKNNAKPFKIQVDNRSTIEVLGTFFNINAYENTIKTTLLEGAINVSSNSIKVSLRPDQQAIQNDKGSLNVVSVNSADAISWQHGIIRFDNAPIKDIIKQMQRWWDFDVEYKDGAENIRFSLILRKNSDFKKILKDISSTTVIKIVQNGNLVTISKS